jgi:hypothetical protein
MKVRMLKNGEGPDGKLTEGRVYELNDKLASQFLKDKSAELVEASDHGIPPEEIELAKKNEAQSVIADPDMSQNENPIDRPPQKPDPDMSKARTAAVVEARDENKANTGSKRKKK